MGRALKDRHEWTPDDVDKVRTLYTQPGVTSKMIADAMGLSYDQVRNKVSALGLTKPTPAPLAIAPLTREVTSPAMVGEVEMFAPEATQPESDEEFLARVVKYTGRAVEKAQSEKFVRLRIATDQPIAVSFSSDWHLTPNGCTHVAGLLDYADAVKQAPGVYAFVVGDLTDNPIKHRGAAGVTAVPDELRLMDLVVGRFGPKLLAMTSGNHDDWTKAFAGVDNLAELARRRRIHYAPDELVILVDLVNPHDADEVLATWCLAMRHKYRRSSAMNPMHGCWRWLEEMANEWPTDVTGRTQLPDVLAIGDNHMAEVATQSVPRGDVAGLRMGSWQVTSPFARGLGFKSYRPTAPTVILHPNRRVPLEAHADYTKALDRLAQLRTVSRVDAA